MIVWIPRGVLRLNTYPQTPTGAPQAPHPNPSEESHPPTPNTTPLNSTLSSPRKPSAHKAHLWDRLPHYQLPTCLTTIVNQELVWTCVTCYKKRTTYPITEATLCIVKEHHLASTFGSATTVSGNESFFSLAAGLLAFGALGGF